MQLPRFASASLLALALLASASEAHADALRRVEHTIEEPEPRRESAGTRSSSGPIDGSPSHNDRQHSQAPVRAAEMSGYDGLWAPGERHRQHDDDADLMLLDMAGRALAFPWVIPRWFDDPRLSRYAAYPYAHGPALLRESDAQTSEEAASTDVLLQLDAETGFLLEGVVPASFALRLLLPHRFELSSRVSLLNDVYQADQSMAAASTSHVAVRYAQTRRVEFRTGLGARMFTLGTLTWGVDLLYAVDAYLSRWSVLRVELHAGTLGSAFAGQARATVGVMIKRCELYAGYDHTAFLGNGKTTLGGPVAGLRAWF